MAFAKNPEFKRSIDGGPPLMRSYAEANSQSFKKGQLVYLSAANAVAAMASDGTTILGQAMDDATNVTSGNTQIRVLIARPGDEWGIKVYTGSTVDAATAAYLGAAYALDVTSNVCTLDLNDTSNDLMNLIAIADTADGGECIVTFIEGCCQYSGKASV